MFSATLSLLDGQDGALALVSDCAAISGTTCADFSDTTSATERVDYTNATSSPQTLFLIVDGYSGTAPPDEGDFSLVTTFRIPACGDGVLDAPAEQCDDGNFTPGDGCDATCQREIPANDTCTTPTALVAGPNGPFSNASATPDYSGYSACPGFATSAVGPDTAYSITIPPRTTLSVTMDVPPLPGPTFDPVLVITTDCATISSATCLADADGGGSGVDETATFTNAGNIPLNVFIIADAFTAPAPGNFTLNTTLTPLPSCTDDTFDGGAGNDSQATATPITTGFNDTSW
jgi:cysteine-rich repeat protein